MDSEFKNNIIALLSFISCIKNILSSKNTTKVCLFLFLFVFICLCFFCLCDFF